MFALIALMICLPALSLCLWLVSVYMATHQR